MEWNKRKKASSLCVRKRQQKVMGRSLHTFYLFDVMLASNVVPTLIKYSVFLKEIARAYRKSSPLEICPRAGESEMWDSCKIIKSYKHFYLRPSPHRKDSLHSDENSSNRFYFLINAKRESEEKKVKNTFHSPFDISFLMAHFRVMKWRQLYVVFYFGGVERSLSDFTSLSIFVFNSRKCATHSQQ